MANHKLEESEIHQLLVKNEVKSGFLTEFLELVKKAKEGKRGFTKNILARDLYDKWKTKIKQ